MNCDELRTLLKTRGIKFDEKSIQNGTRFQCKNGEIFNVFDTGKMSFQGKQATDLSKEIRAIYEGTSQPIEVQTATQPAGLRPSARPVFIVYGHDTSSRDQLELILRRMGLEPVILANVPAAGDTVIEKLEHYLGEHPNVGYACVLLTPDDQGHKAGKPEDIKYRARQNVVLELGMVLSRLGRRRVAILHKQSIELPSDIAGLVWIPFTERVDEVKGQLFTELKQAGYEPSTSGLH